MAFRGRNWRAQSGPPNSLAFSGLAFRKALAEAPLRALWASLINPCIDPLARKTLPAPAMTSFSATSRACPSRSSAFRRLLWSNDFVVSEVRRTIPNEEHLSQPKHGQEQSALSHRPSLGLRCQPTLTSSPARHRLFIPAHRECPSLDVIPTEGQLVRSSHLSFMYRLTLPSERG